MTIQLEKVLQERGITQTQLANNARISRIKVNRVLRGHEPAWPKYRAAIAAALDWPQERASELFEEVEVR